VERKSKEGRGQTKMAAGGGRSVKDGSPKDPSSKRNRRRGRIKPSKGGAGQKKKKTDANVGK